MRREARQDLVYRVVAELRRDRDALGTRKQTRDEAVRKQSGSDAARERSLA
jgi:hypothetical protein